LCAEASSDEPVSILSRRAVPMSDVAMQINWFIKVVQKVTKETIHSTTTTLIMLYHY